MKSMTNAERKRKAKTAKVLAGALKAVGDKPSMTLPVAVVKAMGLPKECKGGRIINDEVLDAEEGTRLCEYEKDGVAYSFGYNEGDDPFGPQQLIVITIDGTFN
jgi:hypothetical protein